MDKAHISEQTVREIAMLSRLELTDDDVEKFSGDLSSILGYVEQLGELDVEAIPPTTHAVRLKNVFREDRVRPSMARDKVLSNAPDAEAGHFKVPQIIQEQ